MNDPGQGLARGATLGLLTVGIERALGFVVLLAVARTLAPSEFGIYAYLLAGIAPVQVMADQGLEIVAVASMARDRSLQGAVLAGVFLARLGLWMVIAAPLAVMVLGETGGGALRPAALAASGLVLVGPSLPYRSLARARGEMGRVFGVMLGDALLGAVFMTGILVAGGGSAALLGARVLASVLVTIAAGRRATVRVRGPVRLAVGQAAELARAAWPLAANALLLTLVVRAGHLVLMGVAGASAVAYLGAASRVAEMVSLLAEGVMLAVFPVMAAAPERIAQVSAQVGRRLALLVVWAVVVVSSGSHTFIAVLFGSEYLPGAAALAILVWGGLFAATGTLVLHGLVAAGRQRLLLATNLGTMAVAVVLQVVLVPRFQLVGSATATVAALAVGQLLLTVTPTSRAAVAASWRAALPVVALGLTTQAVVAAAGLPEWMRGGAAAVMYVAGAWGFGMVRSGDFSDLLHALRGAANR